MCCHLLHCEDGPSLISGAAEHVAPSIAAQSTASVPEATVDRCSGLALVYSACARKCLPQVHLHLRGHSSAALRLVLPLGVCNEQESEEGAVTCDASTQPLNDEDCLGCLRLSRGHQHRVVLDVLPVSFQLRCSDGPVTRTSLAAGCIPGGLLEPLTLTAQAASERTDRVFESQVLVTPLAQGRLTGHSRHGSSLTRSVAWTRKLGEASGVGLAAAPMTPR